MSLSDIKKKIEADASAEAGKILDKAREQAGDITAEVKREVESMKDSYESRFESEKPEIMRRREIVAKLDVKKLELGARQQLVDEVYKGSLEKLRALSAAKYISFVESLLGKAVQTGDEEIFVGKGDKHLSETWLKGYNEKHKTNLTMSGEKTPITGGFVLKRDKISENASFDMLVRWLRDDLEADVVKRLFSE